MKKIVLLFVTIGSVFLISCSKPNEGEEKTKTLNIEIKTGETYTFSENAVTVQAEPNSFVAKIKNNKIEGIHSGKTEATVMAGNITYKCNINVDATHNYFADMGVFIGMPEGSQEKLYGEPIDFLENGLEYGPLLPTGPELMNVFLFLNGKIGMCSIYFSAIHGPSVAEHLNDRYQLYDNSGNIALMGDALSYDDSSLLVLFNYNDSPIYVSYASKEFLATLKSVNGDDMSVLKETFLNSGL